LHKRWTDICPILKIEPVYRTWRRPTLGTIKPVSSKIKMAFSKTRIIRSLTITIFETGITTDTASYFGLEAILAKGRQYYSAELLMS
jgi:hypothetical protein